MKPNAIKLTTMLLLAAAVGWVLSIQNAAASQQAAYVDKGRKLFAQYCATCHGNDAKGRGPVAAALKEGPPDLTLIKAPGEKFPFDHVMTVIDGEKAVTAHGTRKMPVWGTVFRRTKGELIKQADIYSLTTYVQSIQASK